MKEALEEQLRIFFQKIEALEILPPDDRDRSFHKIVGTAPLSAIPNIDFTVSGLPPIILNQLDTDFCTMFSGAALNTYLQFKDLSLVNYLVSKKLPSSLSDRAQLAVKYGLLPSVSTYIGLAKAGSNSKINLQILSKLIEELGDYQDPWYLVAKTKQIRGEYTMYGAHLRDVSQALQKYGTIPHKDSPFHHEFPSSGFSSDKSRDFIANWLNWPKELDAKASINRVGSFFEAAKGPYDTFDNIRSTLWKNKQAKNGAGVLFGVNWRGDWALAPGAIIPSNSAFQSGLPHCIVLIGQKMIEGIPYLVLQQSWGDYFGDKGLYYVPREVINEEFKSGYGAFSFYDLTPGQSKYYHENNISIEDNWVVQLMKILLNKLGLRKK